MNVVEYLPAPAPPAATAIKVQSCDKCAARFDVTKHVDGSRVRCGRCGQVLVVTQGGPAPDTPDSPTSKMLGSGEGYEAAALFLTGALPLGTDASSFVLAFVAGSIGQDAARVMLYRRMSMGIVRVDAISDEAQNVQRALVATMYAKIEFGVRLFLTGPVLPLKPPLRAGMICFVGRRRV